MLFIRPPAWNMGDAAKNQNIIKGTVPYGVLSLMTYINKYKKNDIQLELLDLNIYPWNKYNDDELRFNLNEFFKINDFNIVGLSIMYNHMYKYLYMCDIIKLHNDKTLVIAGGACVTAYHKEIINEYKNIDAICYSEGELPLLQLLESENMYEFLESHQSFFTKNKLLDDKTPSPTFIEDLDTIPLVDFSLIDLTKYSNKYTIMRPKEIINEFCLPITTTRGCPYNCIFCTAGGLSGKKVRKASADKVINDIKEMKEKYGINTLSIEDDQALFDVERAKHILKGISKFNLNLFVAAGFTLSHIDDEIMGLLNDAGLQMLTLPIESGSSYVLHEIINKPIKLNMVSYVVNGLRKNGIYCHGNIIIGFPGEKEEHRQESIDFIKSSGIDWCYIFCATALKGSRLYDECVKNNYINPNQITSDGYFASYINTPEFTSDEITEKAYLMNLELNFVYNNNFIKGDYATAILYHSHITNKYSDHAFAHYFLSKSYYYLNDIERSKFHSERFYKIIEESDTWRKYSKYFNLI